MIFSVDLAGLAPALWGVNAHMLLHTIQAQVQKKRKNPEYWKGFFLDTPQWPVKKSMLALY